MQSETLIWVSDVIYSTCLISMYVLAKVTESYEDVLEKSRFEGEKRITPKFGKIYVGRSDRIITFHINITYSEPVFFKTFLVYK